MAASLVFPQRYQVHVTAEPEGEVLLLTDGPPRPLRTVPPSAFGGPGDRWSRETLLVGAAADCFALTFRALASAAHLSRLSLECDADGTLDRVDRTMQFTAFDIRVHLHIRHGTNEDHARRVLGRTKEACLVSNSLKSALPADHAYRRRGVLGGGVGLRLAVLRKVPRRGAASPRRTTASMRAMR